MLTRTGMVVHDIDSIVYPTVMCHMYLFLH